MYRFSLKHISEWYKKTKRKPLVIRGARQVGKSFLVREFAKEHHLNLLEINLEKHLHLDKIFQTFNTSLILKELEATLGQRVLQKNNLLFLDEIQATPQALPALRYLAEDAPDFPIVTAGSLLEFTLKEHSFSMPVGRIEYYHLGPMTFKEYLYACEENYLIKTIEDFVIEKNLTETAHQKLKQRQREFMLVGGMPEAISHYIETQSLKSVFETQQSILSTYVDDFAKYMRSKKDLLLLQTIFRYVPTNVGRKIKYTNISQQETSTKIKETLQLLSLAKVITPIFHTSASGLPLATNANLDVYKCLFLDIGLMNRSLGLDWAAISSLNERKLINEGGLAEQFIGQHLLYRQGGNVEPMLHYWLREERSKNAEVDYVISQGDWIVPVEVKAGKSGSLKSILQFCYLKEPKLVIRFDMNFPSWQTYEHSMNTKDGVQKTKLKMLSLPVYMVEELNRLIALLRNCKE